MQLYHTIFEIKDEFDRITKKNERFKYLTISRILKKSYI